MFRDGIFENFGDFLDKIKESTTNTKRIFEEVWELESDEEKIASQEFSGIAEQALDGDLDLQEYLKNLWGESWERIKEKLETEGSTWYVWWMDGVREYMKNQPEVEESKDQEPDRKDAEQTMKPQEETPKDDAERLSMEDWSDTDKEGKPKRKDKVEYPSKLQQLTDKNQKQEIKTESRKDPLYLCNSCSKTFRSKESKCTFCESKEVESLSKIKEAGSDVPLSKYVFSVQYILNGKEDETRVMAFDDADARGYVEKWKRGAKVTKVQKIGESKNEALTPEQMKSLQGPKLVFEYGTATTHGKIMEDLSQTDFFQRQMVGTQVKLIDAGGLGVTYAKDEDMSWKPWNETLGWVVESKLQEQDKDSYTVVAKGLEDKRTADDLARNKKGSVIPDAEDPTKYMVLVRNK